MKKLFAFLATLSMLFAVGCNEQGVDDNPNEPIPENIFFGLDKETVSISPDGGSVDVIVYSNYKWEISGTSDWCTPSATSGKANEDGQKVSFSADVAYDNREATFWFRCADEKIKFTVSQSFKEVFIADENNTFNIKGWDQSIQIAYQTNMACDVIIPEEAQSWISIAPATRALVDESVTLNIAANNAGPERSAVVRVVAVNNSELLAEYTITQAKRYYIEYTSTDGSTITPSDSSVFDATILRNAYTDGKGYIDFDAPVTSIGQWAFYECTSLTSVTIPDSVTSIGNNAFAYCYPLKNVTIPDSVTEIGRCAFDCCTSLTSITIPNSVTEIGEEAFYYCGGELIINSKIVEENYYSDNYPQKDGWLRGANFTKLTIGDSVTSIGNYAFAYCDSLTSITIPDSVTSIGEEAFRGCTWLRSVTIGNGVTSIGEWAFAYCDSLTSITIPDSVTSIGEWAFAYCDSLTSITIPDSVTSIGEWAFAYCTSLESVYCKPTTPPMAYGRFGGYSWNAFYDNAWDRKIYVPRASVNAYQVAEGWMFYGEEIEGYDF